MQGPEQHYRTFGSPLLLHPCGHQQSSAIWDTDRRLGLLPSLHLRSPGGSDQGPGQLRFQVTAFSLQS